jgi:transposase-like protein
MAAEAVQCPHCQSRQVVTYGTASNGKVRYRCQQSETCGRTFLRT